MIDQSKGLLEKIKFSRENLLDLSSDEDLSIGIMNLISIEEHLMFTSEKTGDSIYLDLLKEVREMRKDLLAKIVKNSEGETWCISKHLLAASMRLMEVGTKTLGRGNKQEAEEFFDCAYKLYTFFWGINLNVVRVDDIAKGKGAPGGGNSQKKDEKSGSLDELVRKAIDCCIE